MEETYKQQQRRLEAAKLAELMNQKDHSPLTDIVSRIRVERKVSKEPTPILAAKELKNNQEYDRLPDWIKALSPTRNIGALKTLARMELAKQKGRPLIGFERAEIDSL